MKKGKLTGRPRKLTPIEEDGVREMYSQGHSIVEVAYTFGISPSTLSRVVKGYKYPHLERKRDE